MSRGKSSRHAQNPLSGECRETLTITYHALSSKPTSSSVHHSSRQWTALIWSTGIISSSSTFYPHPGRVIKDLFRQLHAVWHGMEALVYSFIIQASCSLLVSGHYLRADCQWRSMVPLLNCGANAALASVLSLV